ncbi:hypothetical protein B0H10DRAFT_2209451 [Mycena sp. CBHHK59/15]|nr:hypothetical protein B0H10DRAFT_2209451 [Mycena sp. CBHHK59/15]
MHALHCPIHLHALQYLEMALLAMSAAIATATALSSLPPGKFQKPKKSARARARAWASSPADVIINSTSVKRRAALVLSRSSAGSPASGARSSWRCSARTAHRAHSSWRRSALYAYTAAADKCAMMAPSSPAGTASSTASRRWTSPPTTACWPHKTYCACLRETIN